MIKLIEEKMEDLENSRFSLIKEKETLNSTINDLTYELSRLNQQSNEYCSEITSLQQQIKKESDYTTGIIFDLESAKNEIFVLEQKNNEIFETLQRELSQRAKEYKERTLNLLTTPSKSVVKSPARQSFIRVDDTEKSPLKEYNSFYSNNTMPVIELMHKTPKRNVSLNRNQQDRISAAALKIMQKQDSPLVNIRISSPSRRSPDRPSPYRKYIRSTPDIKNKTIYNV